MSDGASTFKWSLRRIRSEKRVFHRNSDVRDVLQSTNASDDICLSPNEDEMLLDVLEGHSNKLIAQRLGVTEAAAKSQLEGLLRKISVDNRTQATVWALKYAFELGISSERRESPRAPWRYRRRQSHARGIDGFLLGFGLLAGLLAA
jgi:DNA-binding CsgD family transcriptional regulator